MTTPTSLPTANAWLYGYVDTAVPGYRIVDIGGTDRQAADGYQRFDTFITAVDTALSASSWDAALNTDGTVTLSTGGAAAVVTFEDRVGWLMGWREAEAGDALASAATVTAPWPALGAIPLIGATWTDVELNRETELTVDRTLRGHGYRWGGARLWRWTLTMHRWAYESLREGWCLRGKVSLEGSQAAAIGSAQHDGALTGYALGLESAVVLGPSALAEHYEVSILVAAEDDIPAAEAAWSCSHSVDLDGSTMYVEMNGAEQGWDEVTGGTFAMWVKTDNASGTNELSVIFGTSADPITYTGYLNLDATLRHKDNTASLVLDQQTGLRSASWQHWVVVWDPAGCRLYVDGSLEKTGSSWSLGTYTWAAEAALGRGGSVATPSSYWDGHILEWCHAPGYLADQTAVTALYNSGVPLDARTVSGIGSNIDDYWICSNNAGTSTVTFANIGPAVSRNFTTATLVNGDSADISTDIP